MGESLTPRISRIEPSTQRRKRIPVAASHIRPSARQPRNRIYDGLLSCSWSRAALQQGLQHLLAIARTVESRIGRKTSVKERRTIRGGRQNIADWRMPVLDVRQPERRTVEQAIEKTWLRGGCGMQFEPSCTKLR